MSFNLRFHVRAVFVGGILGALFMACAEGSSLPPPDNGTGGAAGGGSGGTVGIPPGQIGGICDDNTPCVEGSCTKVGANKYCTTPCPPSCPKGTYCALQDGDALCVPDLDSQCLPCTTVLQCLSPSDSCLTAPAGDKFCARDCTTMGECPNGFTCMEAADYPPKENPDPPPDVDAGADGGDAGPQGPPAGVPHKFCVPNVPFSCPCSDKRDGVEKSCTKSNEFGDCSGKETCVGDQNRFEGCTAQTPAAESCNANDDNCDGAVDEGEPNDLCSSEGPVPPNASYACSPEGLCGLGPCAPGWASFPPGPIKNGCACPVEAGESNDTCATATPAGSVSDAVGSSVSLVGTLSAANDVDVWTFDSIDVDEVTTNSYHLSIDFVAPMPNDEFVVDVIRGDACTDNPAGNASGITSYSWCVDGKSADGLSGEVPCADNGGQSTHCEDHSTKYFVRVRRKLGAMGTCTQYNLTVTGRGGDPCDFTQKCE